MDSKTTEMPLGDVPPVVIIKGRDTQKTLQRMSGILDAKEAIQKTKQNIPGVALSIAAIDALYHETRCVLLVQLNNEARRAKVDLSAWIVAGAKPLANGDAELVFESAAKVDAEH